MFELLDRLLPIWQSGGTAGLATVIRATGSAPQSAGSSMAVTPEGEVIGSVSGGCVEATAYDLAIDAARTGRPISQGCGDPGDDVFAVGLTCGGEVELFAEPVSRSAFPHLHDVAKAVAAQRPVAIATVIAHPDEAWLGRRVVLGSDWSAGSLGSARADAAVVDDARGSMAAGRNTVLTYGPDGERRGAGLEVFVATFAPRPRMLVFGATEFAVALSRQGALLGYRVTVCDARPLFATPVRFPDADEVIVDWPDRYLAAEADDDALDDRTVICVLTHDPKFDIPLLRAALRLPRVGYVGAMGSRRTHDLRMSQLRDIGLTDDELGRLSSPIGLDLGGRTPQETAVSIAAEIIARRWGGVGRPLAELDGSIHHG